MMVHELPIRNEHKARTYSDNDRLLPSGGKVDFGNGTDKRKRGKKPRDKKDKKKEEVTLVTLKTSPKLEAALVENLVEKPKKKKNLEKDSITYAGSSFHSSPQALNLPKPSFKKDDVSSTNTSPSSSSATSTSPQFPVTAYPPGSVPNYNYYQHQQHQQQHQQQQQSQQHRAQQYPVQPYPYQHPDHQQQRYPPPPFYSSFNNQPVPSAPVGVSGPAGPHQPFIQPGFQYQVNPLGAIQYPPPNGYLAHPIVSHYQQPASVQGEKISFNQLLGKSDN